MTGIIKGISAASVTGERAQHSDRRDCHTRAERAILAVAATVAAAAEAAAAPWWRELAGAGRRLQCRLPGGRATGRSTAATAARCLTRNRDYQLLP